MSDTRTNEQLADEGEKWRELAITLDENKTRLLLIIDGLINGIRQWASNEDGIPEWIWDDYSRAMAELGWTWWLPVELEIPRGDVPAGTDSPKEADE